jgi:hypothetical protein
MNIDSTRKLNCFVFRLITVETGDPVLSLIDVTGAEYEVREASAQTVGKLKISDCSLIMKP